jgi:photosystem II stability/assembly factor-like uncharacterized protein
MSSMNWRAGVFVAVLAVLIAATACLPVSALASTIGVHATLSLQASTTPTTGSFVYTTLANVAFSNLHDGYGLFIRSSNANSISQYFVGSTGDGGEHFGSLVPVTESRDIGEGVSSITFDRHGNGFAFGPDLFETHDGGHMWSKVAQKGTVLDVATYGRSLWLAESGCAPLAAADKCSLKVLRSSDGGRRWSPTATQPKESVVGNELPQGQNALVLVNQSTAYVLSNPGSSGSTDSAPFWYTHDGGESWTSGVIPCGIDATAAFLSVALDGVLVAVCSGEVAPHGSTQPKTTSVSIDHGEQWTTEGTCQGDPTAPCAMQSAWNSALFGQVEAISASESFAISELGDLFVTTDGGASWQETLRSGSETSGHDQFDLLSLRTAVVLMFTGSGSVGSVLFRTSDGGTTWRSVKPAIRWSK